MNLNTGFVEIDSNYYIMVSRVAYMMVWVFLSILQTCSWSSPQF